MLICQSISQLLLLIKNKLFVESTWGKLRNNYVKK